MPARGTGYAGGKEFQAPGGESVADLRHRIQEFLRGLGEGDHLVFTHGGVIRYLLLDAGRDEAVAPGTLVSLRLTSSSPIASVVEEGEG